jgi:hypothetical protein
VVTARLFHESGLMQGIGGTEDFLWILPLAESSFSK